MLKFAYGVSDFHKIINGGFFYCDRTQAIPAIEAAGEQLLFLRPRRFGKSLLLSTLENYYDVAKANQFEQLFGHLAIGQNPTPLHNQYFILRWDFSLVDPQGEIEEIKTSLYNQLNVSFVTFNEKYRPWLEQEIPIADDPLASFGFLLGIIQTTPYKLYLLIDEYDSFANEVMMSSLSQRHRYEELVHGEGLFRTLFRNVKGGAAGRGLDRVFITGVSPIALSDVTSSYNVARDISLNQRFNLLCGFTEDEVRAVLSQVVADCGFAESQTDTFLATMRDFYNGYTFLPEAPPNIYNPTLVIYFLQNLSQDCRPPREMLDYNLSPDRDKVRYISALPGGQQLILDIVNEDKPLAIARLAQRFGVYEMFHVNPDATFLGSLLYFLGVLTFNGENLFGEVVLRIPNLVVRGLYVEHLREMLLPNWATQDAGGQAGRHLLQQGDVRPVCQFVEQSYFPALNNRDYRWANELTVKTAFLTLLFNDLWYVAKSEVAAGRGYADLFLVVRPDMRRYPLWDIILEFKYLSLKSLTLTSQQVQAMSAAELAALPQVQEKLAEARQTLIGYHELLKAEYPQAKRWRVVAIVAVAFERLVWEVVV